MRHGRKRSPRRIDGYKAYPLTDHDTEPVLGVAATPAIHPDGPEAVPVVAGPERSVCRRERCSATRVIRFNTLFGYRHLTVERSSR